MHCVILNVLDDLQSIVSLFDIWELLNGKVTKPDVLDEAHRFNPFSYMYIASVFFSEMTNLSN